MFVNKGATALFSELINPVKCLQQIVSDYTEYKIIAEQEQTKRFEIDAWEKVTIAKIHDQRDLLMEYLNRSFDERAANFRTLFSVVD